MPLSLVPDFRKLLENNNNNKPAALLTAKLACHVEVLQAQYTLVKIMSSLVLQSTLVQFVKLSWSEGFFFLREK